MGRLGLTILLCILGLCSSAVEFKNLCSGGCCGTGMHTPDAETGSYTGANDHLYTIYDPRDDSEEDWDYWNIICRVLFCLRNYLKPHTSHMITSDSNRAIRHSRKSGCS